MRIAMMVRGYVPVPRPSDMIYAPIDLAAGIAKGLVGRGHQVDFFAPLGSEIKGVKIESLNLRPLINDQQEFRGLITNIDKMVHGFPHLWEGFMVQEMFKRAETGQYDLLHFHHPEAALQQAIAHRDVPVLYTIHDPMHDWNKELFKLYSSPNQHFVSISNNQRRDAPDLPYWRTVYNGIDVKNYPFSDETEDYLLYAGRVVPDKGVREAVQVAKETSHRLLIIGPIYPDTQGYFDQYIKPFLDDQILYLGFLEQKQLARYYQKAKALLTPVQWEEPFGLTTIEAMASGTPVIAFRRGAAPEIIVDGKTGYVVNTTVEMIEAVHKIRSIRRIDCRNHVKANFSLRKMTLGYESAMQEIIASHHPLVRRNLAKRLRGVRKVIHPSSPKKRLRRVLKSTAAKAKDNNKT